MTRESLTDDEDRVLGVVCRQCRLGDPVASRDVRELVGHRVDRQLRSLVVKGYIRQMAKGYWLPSPDLTPELGEVA